MPLGPLTTIGAAALPTAAAGAAGGGLLAKLLGFLKKDPKTQSSGLDDILGPIGSIASLFRKSPAGLQKITDTKSQQAIESAARDIESRVMNGSLGADEGLQAIADLERSAGALSPGGSAISNAVLSQIKANIQNRRSGQLGEFSRDPGLTGAVPFQKDKLTTLLRNRGVGQTQATEGLAGSPFERLFQTSNPLDLVGSTATSIREAFPESPEFETFRNKLKARRPLSGGF